jgi:hypothetical protein
VNRVGADAKTENAFLNISPKVAYEQERWDLKKGGAKVKIQPFLFGAGMAGKQCERSSTAQSSDQLPSMSGLSASGLAHSISVPRLGP